MPLRTTRKRTRPRASDRSMVATVQPHGLICFETDRRRRCLKKMPAAEMQSFRATTPDLLRAERGWMSQIKTAAPGGGRKMFLTSPFIDQAILLIDPSGRKGNFATQPKPSSLGGWAFQDCCSTTAGIRMSVSLNLTDFDTRSRRVPVPHFDPRHPVKVRVFPDVPVVCGLEALYLVFSHLLAAEVVVL